MSLQEHYLREVLRSSLRIKRLLLAVAANPDSYLYRSQLKAWFENIRDLAMIHGHDATEKIVTKICWRLDRHLSNKQPLDRLLLFKMSRTLGILHDLAGLEESLEDRSSVATIRCNADVALPAEPRPREEKPGSTSGEDEDLTSEKEHGIVVKVVDEDAEGLTQYIQEELEEVIHLTGDVTTAPDKIKVATD